MRHAAVEHPNGVEVPVFKEKISQIFENQYKNQEKILNHLFQEEKNIFISLFIFDMNNEHAEIRDWRSDKSK